MFIDGFCSYEAKRTRSPPCAEGTLHRESLCFIFHASKVCFIEKSTLSRAFSVIMLRNSTRGIWRKIEVCRAISAIYAFPCLAQPNSTIRAFKPYEIAQLFLPLDLLKNFKAIIRHMPFRKLFV